KVRNWPAAISLPSRVKAGVSGASGWLSASAPLVAGAGSVVSWATGRAGGRSSSWLTSVARTVRDSDNKISRLGNSEARSSNIEGSREFSAWGFRADSVDRRAKKEFVVCQNPAVAGGRGRQLNAASGTSFEFTLRTSSGILPSHLKR